MKNIIGGEVKPMSKAEFYALFAPETQDELERKWVGDTGLTGFVCYENLQMDSSQFGTRTALAFGAGFSAPNPERAVEMYPRLGDVPSRFQYPVAYCSKFDAYSNHHEENQS